MMNIKQLFSEEKKNCQLDKDEYLNSLYQEHENETHPLDGYTYQSINEEIYEVLLQELNERSSDIKQLYQSLNGYKVVNDLSELKAGQFMKMYKKGDDKIRLCGRYTTVTFTENGSMVKCLTTYNKVFQYNFDNYVTFRKLSDDELVYLSAI